MLLIFILGLLLTICAYHLARGLWYIVQDVLQVVFALATWLYLKVKK